MFAVEDRERVLVCVVDDKERTIFDTGRKDKMRYKEREVFDSRRERLYIHADGLVWMPEASTMIHLEDLSCHEDLCIDHGTTKLILRKRAFCWTRHTQLCCLP